MASKNQKGNGNSKKKELAAPSGKQLPLESGSTVFTPFILGIIAALLFIIILLTDTSKGMSGAATGVVGYFFCSVLYGLFGWGCWFIPFILVYLALVWRRSCESRTTLAKCVSAVIVLITISSIMYMIFTASRYEGLPSITEMWQRSISSEKEPAINRGGLLGTLLAWLYITLFRKIAWVIDLVVLIFAMLVLVEVTPIRAAKILANRFRMFRLYLARRRDDKLKMKQEAEMKKAQSVKDNDAEDDEVRVKRRIFPEQPEVERVELPERKKNTKKKIGISPLDYKTVEPDGDEIGELEISETLPPVLENGGKPTKNAKKSPEFVDPNPYARVERSPDDASAETVPFSDTPSDTVPITETDDSVEATDGLYDFLFADGPSRPVMPEKADIGGSDVNVIPINPTHIEKEVVDQGEPEQEIVPEKTDDERFAEISDLREVGDEDNDHAGTDPDLADPDEIEKKPEYKFPPLTMLHKDVGGVNADHSEELRANGIKLVSTLESFKVRTKITNISRGPTITRYELLPDQGVRVRAIANLVDDIALNLATSGVRIEAPIPGKPAVGIEVPNAVAETVYLRDLLENPKFEQAGSKVTAALGMDVAGDPIFVDISKMPHLLIAGTTGSGKSVCINSIITSLLFRAAPDEVKLILIDPKKVELGVYNRLPHLLIPVVTNPKKAAGALTWAVSEMERRYELIEEAGVRDIKGYNRQIDDGELEGEKMSSIVIVIDELADLMMTAPDTVEESICRLAQKARAAGMHLIIGTQRPSVDVITGLIKANIPSRIAFTVKSNIDSRTIIDVAGAEKLIGHGDMLYAPVGAMKPIRVQGAFVADKEVEAVCDFIRAEAGEVSYDQRTIDEIREHEAECEEIGKKGGFMGSDGSDDEEDPKFAEAVRVAVENGKISTSLLQRRLALGYGRAAKIIDRMETMGIVSAPDGQKPRNVLINMQDYQEMILKKSD